MIRGAFVNLETETSIPQRSGARVRPPGSAVTDEVVKVAKLLYSFGVKILADHSTATKLRDRGVRCRTASISTRSGYLRIAEKIAEGEIDLLLLPFPPPSLFTDLPCYFKLCSLTYLALSRLGRTAVAAVPAQMPSLREELASKNGKLSAATRLLLTLKTLDIISEYQRVLPHSLEEALAGERTARSQSLSMTPYRIMEGVGDQAEQILGPELSAHHLVDLQVALQYVREYVEPAAVMIRFGKILGIAQGHTLEDAILKATGSLSYGISPPPFQAVIAVNRPVDPEAASHLASFDAILAPAYDLEAMALLKEKQQVRLLTLRRSLPDQWAALTHLLQETSIDDRELLTFMNRPIRVVTRNTPSPHQWKDLLLSWKLVQKIPAASVVVVKGQHLRGVGAGLGTCLSNVKLALEQAATASQNATLASGRFLPFKEGIELAGQFGISAVIQPGGSIRDPEIISTANYYQMAMIFTGVGLYSF